MTQKKQEDFAHIAEKRRHWLTVESFLQVAAVGAQTTIFTLLGAAVVKGRTDFLSTPLFWLLIAADFLLWGAMFAARETWMYHEKRSEHDLKTGLYHQGYFDKTLEREIRRAGRYKYPLTLVRIDIDEFTSFNQHYGRKQGDMLLQQFSDFLRAGVRTTDTLARYDKDEFCILLPHTELIKAEKFISRLLAHSQERLDCSFSAGLTTYHLGESKFQFLHRADLALHQARVEGYKKVRCLVSGTDSHAVLSF